MSFTLVPLHQHDGLIINLLEQIACVKDKNPKGCSMFKIRNILLKGNELYFLNILISLHIYHTGELASFLLFKIY